MRRSYLTTRRLACVCLTILSSGVSFAQGGFSCQRQDTPVSVRSEGITELISDIVLQCTGGTPGTLRRRCRSIKSLSPLPFRLPAAFGCRAFPIPGFRKPY